MLRSTLSTDIEISIYPDICEILFWIIAAALTSSKLVISFKHWHCQEFKRFYPGLVELANTVNKADINVKIDADTLHVFFSLNFKSSTILDLPKDK